MRKNIVRLITGCFITLSLSACGGGGGGSSPPVPTTKVVLSAFLFGTMSSSTAKVTAIDAAIKVPLGIFANYSAPVPLDPQQHIFPLRSGSITFSGLLLNSPTDLISGSYNTQTGIIKFSMPIPLANNSIPDLKSSTVGNGTEFAKIYFKLAAADSNIPFQPSSSDLVYEIKQSDLTSFDVPTKRYELKFSASYQ